jgi:hypothetical protein
MRISPKKFEATVKQNIETIQSHHDCLENYRVV